MEAHERTMNGRQRAGGVAAWYMAGAYLVAMPYFLLVVDYAGAVTAEDKVALITGNRLSMYVMYLVTYVVFGIVLGVLSLSLHERLQAVDPFWSRIATAVGLLWSVLLVASGMVFNYGLTTVSSLAAADRAAAVTTWRAIEPVAQGLGGAGGETIGGLWILLVCAIAIRGRVLPRALGWMGVGIGVAGLASTVPVLQPLAYVFGLLQIVWLIWLGVTMVRGGSARAVRSQALPVDDPALSLQ